MNPLEKQLIKPVISLIFVTIALTTPSCSTSLKSSVPSIKNNAEEPNGVKLVDIEKALKIQIGQALKEIKVIQKNNPTSPIAKLKFKTGEGFLTTTVVSSKSDTGNIDAIVPFSGLVDTGITPSWKGSRAAKDTRTEKSTFKIDISKIGTTELKSLSGGSVIKDALVQKYKRQLDLSKSNNGKPIGVSLIPNSISITTTFNVAKSRTGKLAFEIIPTGHIISTKPEASIEHTNNTTNTVNITMPFITAAQPPGDTRRLIYFEKGSKGWAFLDVPANDAIYDKVVGGKLGPQVNSTLKIKREDFLGPNNKIRPEFLNNPELFKHLLEERAVPESDTTPLREPTFERSPPGF